MTEDQAIDFVVTWVDGSDPIHAAKRARFAAKGWGSSATRFTSHDEIRFCLLSILRNAPFARRIFLVTDHQRPAVLDELAATAEPGFEKITLIDHRDIFHGYEDILPVFCSTSIELMLHRIPGLAERFVTMNDDFMLTQPCTPSDFFTEDSVVMRGCWFGPELDVLNALDNLVFFWRPIEKRTVRSKEKCRKSARLVGQRWRTFVPSHTPYAARVSTFAQAFAQFPDAYLASLRPRFRRADKLGSWALSCHMEMQRGSPRILGEDEAVYIVPERSTPAKMRRKLRMADSAKFLCIQSLDQTSPAMREEITAWLRAKFPMRRG